MTVYRDLHVDSSRHSHDTTPLDRQMGQKRKLSRTLNSGKLSMNNEQYDLDEKRLYFQKVFCHNSDFY